MADCDNLEERFENATRHLETLVATLNDNQKLYFYARFKQAKEGPCNIPKPGFLNFAAKSKWCSWNELGKMSREQAMEEYIEGIIKIDPDWIASAKSDGASMFGTGFAVSRFKADDAIEDKDKNVFDWVKEGRCERVELLLKNGSCHSNNFDEEGLSLLHWACDRGHSEMVDLLLRHGADINIRDSEGQTPLHYASFCGHSKVVDLLLTRDADVTILDNEGLNACGVASDTKVAAVFSNR